MNKKLLLLFVIFISFAASVLPQALTGDKIIKASGGDYPTLEAAIAALNANGASGTVRFLIDEDLFEIGANLVINRSDLNATNNLVIKPNAGKTPTIRINNCATTSVGGSQADTARRQAGLTLVNTGFVTIDGANTSGGSTRDLTFLMGDAVNGISFINLFGNCDNAAIKNTKILYDSINAGNASTRGIYTNGQWTGAADFLTVENCQIGNGVLDPWYGVSVTGHTATLQRASNTVIKKNVINGRLRVVYFFQAGSPSGAIEISDNIIDNKTGPGIGNVVWGVLLNTYDGAFNFFNNKMVNITSVNNTASGVYGFGTLSGTATSSLNIYNNFLGGNIQHTGTGAPASIDVISLDRKSVV